MEKITRHIMRKRSDTFTQEFKYTTYDIIFNEKFRKANPKAAGLMRHMEEAFLEGVPERDQSASKMPELEIKTKQHFGHRFSELAAVSNYMGQGNKQHGIVQAHFMRNHPECVGVEVPVWDEKINGFCDFIILQLKPFKVIIPDFKPNAHAEKKAATQLYHLKMMLVERTGIDPKYIDLFYFDHINCYEVIA